MGNYWVFRTDTKYKEFFYTELQEGRLRQGWGYLDNQNLNILKSKFDAGKQLDNDELACWRGNRKMHYSQVDGIKNGDIIITPNLPEHGKWLLVEVTGEYEFDRTNKYGDFGHTLIVKLLTDKAINPHNEIVSGYLRGTMRTPMRLWNINGYKDDVERILIAIKENYDFTSTSTYNEKMLKINKIAKSKIEAELKHRFRGAEFEEPIRQVLRNIYGESEEYVAKKAGPKEMGADFICKIKDPIIEGLFSAIQVKMWENELTDLTPLKQIEIAYNSYPNIVSGLVITMCDKLSDEYDKEQQELSKELHIPIQTLLKDETLDLIMKNLPDLIS